MDLARVAVLVSNALISQYHLHSNALIALTQYLYIRSWTLLSNALIPYLFHYF